MASRNRVDPWGVTFATAERGYFMGNRDAREAWITCWLRDPDGAQTIAPVKYEKLFFLDEATALAAGHRPCAYCRPRDYKLFLRLVGAEDTDVLDAVLSRERAEREAGQHETAIAEKLPPGAMFVVEKDSYLAWQRLAFRWSPGGYTPAGRLDAFKRVSVLTLPSVVRAVEAGYRPWVHPSVLRG